MFRGLSCKNGKKHYFVVRDEEMQFIFVVLGGFCDHALIDVAILYFTAVFRRQLS